MAITMSSGFKRGQQQPQQYSGPAELDLDREIVLVKFNFKRRGMVPKNIPQVEREPDHRMDVLHQREALMSNLGQGLTQTGRYREGRVDTGKPVITARHPVQVGLLRRGLANNGFRLQALHWFMRTKTDPSSGYESKTYVVNACFARVEEGIELSSTVSDSLRELANMVWANAFVWDNPNGVATINMVGRVDHLKPKLALAVRNGVVKTIDVSEPMSEEAEAPAA